MGILTFALILIIALLGYIVFLHIQLAKKNIFIESTVKRLSGIERSRSMDEMVVFLEEIQKLSRYNSFFSDKFQDDSTIDFIIGTEKDHKTFIHYTKDERDARNILSSGFRFAESFYKTALPVSNDRLDMTIKHNSRRTFGDFLIVICISNDVVNFYSMELEKAGLKNYSFENLLTETPPSLNDNSEIVYLLAQQYIKGFINHRTGEISKNPAFDPYYNSSKFMKNIDSLKNKQGIR